MQYITNYIGGEQCSPIDGEYINNFNPSRGTPYSFVPNSNEKDVKRAVDVAHSAFLKWSNTSVEERSWYLKKMAQGIAQRATELAKAESIDTGKPISLSTNLDIPRAQKNLEFFAEQIQNFNGESFKTDDKAINNVKYSPLGVVACISPWNLPLYLFTWKVAPALAAGNTVVAKPSEITPMTAFHFGEIAQEVGLPPGVLNIVHGDGAQAGRALVASDIKAISFTGSTVTGRLIAQETASQFKKLSLEMGGKNPHIIFSDCDFDKTLETTVRSSFLNQGQICLCGSRIFIQEGIYHKFKNALVEKTKSLKIGDPLDETTDQGALVSATHLEKVMNYIELAKKEGGKILCGGEKPRLNDKFNSGYFLSPTLIEGLLNTASVNQEEIFGPVATLIPFKTEEEVINMANKSRYGLSASVFTKNLNIANYVAEKLAAGTVWINTWMLRDLRAPFGGVKESGMGREGGLYGLKFFSEVKNICVGLS